MDRFTSLYRVTELFCTTVLTFNCPSHRARLSAFPLREEDESDSQTSTASDPTWPPAKPSFTSTAERSEEGMSLDYKELNVFYDTRSVRFLSAVVPAVCVCLQGKSVVLHSCHTRNMSFTDCASRLHRSLLMMMMMMWIFQISQIYSFSHFLKQLLTGEFQSKRSYWQQSRTPFRKWGILGCVDFNWFCHRSSFLCECVNLRYQWGVQLKSSFYQLEKHQDDQWKKQADRRIPVFTWTQRKWPGHTQCGISC